MGTAKRDVHVVPNHTNGRLNWSVKRENAERATRTYQNKPDAMAKARQIGINHRLEVVEHRKDGIIMGSNSYGNDPRRSRG
jgi:hypothetical protein